MPVRPVPDDMGRVPEIPVAVCIGVGGTFDFLSGTTPRAPQWMQDKGVEFVWRVMHDPWRLGKRYLHDFWHFVPNLWWQRHALKRSASKNAMLLEVTPIEGYAVFNIGGHFDNELLAKFEAKAEDALNEERHLILDFKQGTTFSADSLGRLLNLPRRAAYKNCHVYLVTPPRGIESILSRSQLDSNLFRIVPDITAALKIEKEDPWQLQCASNRVLITLNNQLSRHAIQRLEKICSDLLRKGRYIDLDTRNLFTADSMVLLTLHRLANLKGDDGTLIQHFRVVPGKAVTAALQREKATDLFQTIAPQDLSQISATTTDENWEILAKETFSKDNYILTDERDNVHTLFAPQSGKRNP